MIILRRTNPAMNNRPPFTAANELKTNEKKKAIEWPMIYSMLKKGNILLVILWVISKV